MRILVKKSQSTKTNVSYFEPEKKELIKTEPFLRTKSTELVITDDC